nr:MAG TPA: hypothetical protein [Caudoviricetes sp.]
MLYFAIILNANKGNLSFFIINLFVVQDWATFLMLIYE